jgi:hypothetical protein
MNERLPYEEQLSQQWIDLPLPDENMAWADMKRRLDENKRRIIPFWWSGCAGWGLLGILLLGIGWWIVRPEKWFEKKRDGQSINTVIEKDRTKENNTVIKLKDSGITTDGKNKKIVPDSNTATRKQPLNDSSTGEKQVIQTNATINHKEKVNLQNREEKEIIPASKIDKQKMKVKNKIYPQNKKDDKDKQEIVLVTGDGNKNKVEKAKETDQEKTITIDSSSETRIVKPLIKTDTVQENKPDTTIKKTEQAEEVKVNKPTADSAKKKIFLFSAGIGLHQQIPLAGQKLTPYNSLGRKGSIADYIPSVYVRLEKIRKWFLQAEFRYGAPQYTKEFTYKTKSVPDTGFNPQFSTYTSSKLKKTFYHQFPVTFNYFVMPNWSVGAGFQWNKFNAAVTEKNISRLNNFTLQDSLVSKLIETVKKDSATEFAKSYFQFVLETQYKWKRLSIGAKYSFGLQPYIKFTLPGEPEKQERNNALQIFIRYELWKQKKNKN